MRLCESLIPRIPETDEVPLDLVFIYYSVWRHAITGKSSSRKHRRIFAPEKLPSMLSTARLFLSEAESHPCHVCRSFLVHRRKGPFREPASGGNTGALLAIASSWMPSAASYTMVVAAFAKWECVTAPALPTLSEVLRDFVLPCRRFYNGTGCLLF